MRPAKAHPTAIGTILFELSLLSGVGHTAKQEKPLTSSLCEQTAGRLIR